MGQLQRAGTVWSPTLGQYFCFAYQSSSYATSPDLVNWQTFSGSGPAQNYNTPQVGNGVFASGGASLVYSLDGSAWVAGVDSAGLTLDSTTTPEFDATAGQFVAYVFSRNSVWTSYNGALWKLSTKPWTGPPANWLAAAQTRPQQFVSTATVGSNQSNYGNPSSIKGKLYVPHNFTKLIQVAS